MPGAVPTLETSLILMKSLSTFGTVGVGSNLKFKRVINPSWVTAAATGYINLKGVSELSSVHVGLYFILWATFEGVEGVRALGKRAKADLKEAKDPFEKACVICRFPNPKPVTDGAMWSKGIMDEIVDTTMLI
eukprot:Gb_03817 [translate_table: standard]